MRLTVSGIVAATVHRVSIRLASVVLKAIRLTGHKVKKDTRRMLVTLKISRISAAASPKSKRKAGSIEMVASSASASDALFRENLGTTF